jgi:hypothetical protein
MPFSCSEFINNTTDYVLNSPVIGRIIKNPIYTGILIALIITIIVLIMFRNVETGEGDSLLKLSLRSGIYTLFITTAFLFFHSAYIKSEFVATKGGEEVESIFKKSAIDPDTLGAHIIRVPPPVDPSELTKTTINTA